MKHRILVTPLVGTKRHFWLNPQLVVALLNLSADSRFNVTVSMIQNVRPIDHARNCAIMAARARSADYLLMADNDIAPSANLGDLILEAATTGKDVYDPGEMALMDFMKRHAKLPRIAAIKCKHSRCW